MKAYKGFDKRLKCRGFQYEVGKEYEEEKAELCNCGFHACENPLNCFTYYAPADSRFCEVELDGVSDEKSNDSKVCGKHISISAEIGLKGIIEAGVKFIMDKVDFKNAKEVNTGRWSAATNTGRWSAATNTGDQSAATNTGYQSAATNTGDQSAATVSGKDSVAIATGYQSKAKACLGSAICVVERGEWNGNTYPLLAIKSAIVDGETLKADTFYTLKNGEFVEVPDDES